jgi:two-component system chemotaxis sensor kinase CheA
MGAPCPDLPDLAGDLHRLALKAVMLSPDDLPSLGAFLAELDGVRGRLAGTAAGQVLPLVDQLLEVTNRLILQEIPAAARALELLGQGVSLLQHWAGRQQPPETAAEWNSYRVLLADLGLSAPWVQDHAGPGAPPFEDAELVESFLAEAAEHLEGIETHLVQLEQQPGDLHTVNAIFRPFHTIKGVAGFLNLEQIQAASHELESLLDRLRSGTLEVSPALVDVVLFGVDLLKEMLADLRGVLAGAGPLKVFDLAPLTARIAALEDGAAARPRLGEILVGQGDLNPADLAAALERQQVSGARQPLGEILVEEGRVSPQKVAQALVQQLSDGKAGAEAGTPAAIRVDLAKLDSLVDLMGELVIVQSQVRHHPLMARAADQKLVRDLGQMTRITTELQKISMSLRMVPIGATLRRMVRLVRDLSHKTGKLVNLRLEGEDTEIDRNMVEAIYDPLVHLVRNAVDHGLESPEAREAAGKPREGRLTLRAYHKGGSVIIDIEDDGRGLDREAILAKARKQGLAGPGELSPAQIDHLIFEAGFSTAARVTEVSGRGVGLDVVKQTVERLRGKIEICSRPQEGCRFSLRLPLTLAIIDGLVIRVGAERYILPSVAVRETLRPSRDQYFTVEGKGELIRVRRQLMPLIRLGALLGGGPPDQPPWEALVMVVEQEGAQRALLADEILGKQEVVIKSLGTVLQNRPGLAGGTILGDGRVGLILDLEGLFQLAQSPSARGEHSS